MAYLIGTNVISETLKSRPEARVIDWLGSQKANDLFLASVSLGELVRGARQARDKAKRERFKRWIEQDLASQFNGRILPFDQEAAVMRGSLRRTVAGLASFRTSRCLRTFSNRPAVIPVK